MTRSPRQALMLALVLFTATCAPTGSAASGSTSSVSAPDPSNATFMFDRDSVTLANGRAERAAASGSATKVTTTLGDQRAVGDVDGDGRPDTVVELVYQPGGSGTFYYVAVLLNAAGGVTATPAVLLGDRITVTTVRLDGRTIVVDLLDRSAGQPLSASPSVALVRRFVVDHGALIAQ